MTTALRGRDTGGKRTVVRRKWMIHPMLVASLLVLSACGGDGQPAGAGTTGKFPVTVPSCERTVTIEQPAKRVLTVASDSATALAAIGAADLIIARSAEGGAPLGPFEDELREIPQITTNGEPSREVIIGQQPDLVISYAGLDTPAADLEAAGIDSIVPSWRCDQAANLDGIYRTLETYGQILGTEDGATKTVANLRSRVSAVTKQFQGTPARTAANVYVSENQIRVYGGPSMSNTVLQTLGLTNVFADVNKRLTEVSTEELLARNPDVILLTFGGSETAIKNGADAERALRGMTPLDQLTAVRENRLIAINFTYLVGGPLTVNGLETIAQSLAALN
ncbi:MAG: ABC transporter substrate-binding protein [Pseudonocardiaceae bacterium]